MEDKNQVVIKLISDTQEKPEVRPEVVAEAETPPATSETEAVATTPAAEAPAPVEAPAPAAAPVTEQVAKPVAATPPAPTEDAHEANAPAEVTNEAPAPVKESPPEQPADNAETASSPTKKNRRLPQLSKGTKFLLVLGECMLLIIALVVFSRTVSLNKDDDVVYIDLGQVDDISCNDGVLNVNNVSVGVPTDNSVSYKISYTWGPDDTDYPTIPHSVTASYFDKEGNQIYDISLYRDSITPADGIPQGKDANNWFDDWATDDDKTKQQIKKDSGSIHGFLVSSREEIQKDDTGKTYGSTSYYFALQSPEGMSVYILEGILYDKASVNTFDKVMEDCINAIKIKPDTV